MYKRRIPYNLFFFIMLGAFVTTNTFAQIKPPQPNPQIQLENAINAMFDAINEQRATLKKQPTYIYTMVEEILVPHIDFITASRWVLGKHWRNATKQQKIQFIKEFRSLIILFYSTALVEYLNSNDKRLDKNIIRFLPLRFDPAEKDVTIRSEVFTRSGKHLTINYYTHHTHKGWKVYDVSVEGISVVTTYRTSFSQEIHQHGIEGLLNILEKRNQRLQQANTINK